MLKRLKTHLQTPDSFRRFTCFLFLCMFCCLSRLWAGGASWTSDQEDQSSQENVSESQAQQTQLKPNKIQKELIRKIDDLYREIVAATRADRLTHALDKIELAEALLDPDILPEDYCQRFRLKIERVKEDMRQRYLRDVHSGRRQKEERMLEHLMISSLPEMSQIPLPTLPHASTKSEFQPEEDQAMVLAESPIAVRPPAPRQERYQPEPGPVVAKPAARQTAPVDEMPEKESKSVVPNEPRVSEPDAIIDLEPDVMTETLLLDNKVEYYQMLDEKLDMLYEDGLAFYRQGLYDQARRILNSVNQASPGYKLTEEYLRLIDRQTEDIPVKRTEMLRTSAGSNGDKRAAVIDYYLDIYE